MLKIFLLICLLQILNVTTFEFSTHQPKPKANGSESFPPKPKSNKVPIVKFPFQNIRNEKNQLINIIAISAPFRNITHEKLYQEYKKMGLSFIGISSYINFPDHIYNPYEDRYHEKRHHDYLKMVKAWLYCTRSPSKKMIASGLPLLQLTQADLKTPSQYIIDKSIKQQYDFIYYCPDDNKDCKPGWQSYNRNWNLAKRSLVTMCEYNLTGLMIGRTNCTITNYCNGKITRIPFQKNQSTYQKLLQKARFLFVPNIADASPRVITEAMLFNIPVLVNENILGGWHNVVSGVTGEYFTNETNIVRAINKFKRSGLGLGLRLTDRNKKNSTYTPRKWYIDHRGLNSKKLLASFLKIYYKNISDPFINQAVFTS